MSPTDITGCGNIDIIRCRKGLFFFFFSFFFLQIDGMNGNCLCMLINNQSVIMQHFNLAQYRTKNYFRSIILVEKEAASI